MTSTASALWLNSFFAEYDSLILGFAHKLAEVAGSVLTPLNSAISFLGEKGLIFLLLALIMLLFPRWRKAGLCVILSIALGYLFSNLILKSLVARPRPFEASDVYRQWWQAVGSPAETGSSFPSGHVTAAAAAAAAFSLIRGRKWLIPGIIWVVLMMISRNYLIAHYPSDVLFAVFLGIFCAFLAEGLTALIYRFLEKHSGEKRVYDTLLDSGLESFSDVKEAFGKRQVSSKTNHSAASEAEAAASAPVPSRSPRPAASRRLPSASAGKHGVKTHDSRSSGTYQGKH